MDLYIDQDYLADGSRALADKRDEMEQLRSEIKTSFEQLRKEWDSSRSSKRTCSRTLIDM